MFLLHQYEPEGLTTKMNTADAPSENSSEEDDEPVHLWRSARNKKQMPTMQFVWWWDQRVSVKESGCIWLAWIIYVLKITEKMTWESSETHGLV